MDFKKAGNLSMALIVSSIAACIFGLLFSGNEEYVWIQMVLTVAAALLMIAGIIVTYVCCRCPYCGKRIVLGAYKVIYCPKCRRNLETGKKVSKKKAKTMRK